MEGPQKSNEIKGLAAYRLSIKSGADFTASANPCQPRATLQICNEKLLALSAERAIIGA